jgi:hypothetical protein
MGRGRRPTATGSPAVAQGGAVKPLVWGEDASRTMFDRPEPCPQCYDPISATNLGHYMYDENHGTICDLCCTHAQGWWLLTEHYGNPGMWCCKAGCGHSISEDEYLALIGGQEKRRSRVSPLAG